MANVEIAHRGEININMKTFYSSVRNNRDDIVNTVRAMLQHDEDYLKNAYVQILADLIEAIILAGLNPISVSPYGEFLSRTFMKSSVLKFNLELGDPANDCIDKLELYSRLADVMLTSDKFKIDSCNQENQSMVCQHLSSRLFIYWSQHKLLNVCKSTFFMQLIHSDRRFRDLILLLDYWSYMHKHRITRYALLLLITFYLQNTTTPVIPSLELLRSGQTVVIMDGYDYTFNDAALDAYQNEESTLNLLKGFFAFYSTFDFASQIISPYLGMAIQRSEIASNYPEFAYLLSPIESDPLMIIQDPFVLQCNAGRIWHSQIFTIFKNSIMDANRLCANSRLSPAHMLTKLYYNAVPRRRLDKRFLCELPTSEAELARIRSFLPPSHYKTHAFEKFWVRLVLESLKAILTDEFGMELHTVKEKKFALACRYRTRVNVWSDTKTWHEMRHLKESRINMRQYTVYIYGGVHAYRSSGYQSVYVYFTNYNLSEDFPKFFDVVCDRLPAILGKYFADKVEQFMNELPQREIYDEIDRIVLARDEKEQWTEVASDDDSAMGSETFPCGNSEGVTAEASSAVRMEVASVEVGSVAASQMVPEMDAEYPEQPME